MVAQAPFFTVESRDMDASIIEYIPEVEEAPPTVVGELVRQLGDDSTAFDEKADELAADTRLVSATSEDLDAEALASKPGEK